MKKTALLLTGLTLLAFMPNARAEIASKAYVDAELEGKMDTMTVDSTPTYNSSNLVSSGGVKTYVDNLETGVYGIAFGGVPGTGNVNSDIAEVSSAGGLKAYVDAATADISDKLDTDDFNTTIYGSTSPDSGDVDDIEDAGGLKAYVDDVHDYASNINTGIYTLSFGGMPGTGNVNSDIAEVSSAGGFKAYVDAATADISDKLDTDDFNITIYGSTSPASVDVGDIEDYGGLKAYVDAAVSDAGGSVDGLRDDFNITMYGSTDPDSGDQADVANAGGFKAYIDADKLDADGWIPGIMQVSNGSDTPSTIPGINASHIVSEGISIDRINLPPVPSACSANGGSCVLMYVGGQGYTWEIMSRGSNESAPSTNFDGTLYRQGAEVAPAYPQVVGPIN
ncbi:MAG: hypothetical protein J6W79_02795 [Alphaproteobacteria bacterium]|nr:hypothetical protein [Alphaproteobacteria bacterium]